MKFTAAIQAIPFLSLILLFAGVLKAQNSNIVIEVEAARIRPAATPDSTPLQDIPGLTLRQQGQGNPQSDLSIRGASFSAAGLTLDGLTLRNAQTEHWHASIATPSSWLEQPYIVTGLERFRLSTGHPAGSVALTLAPLLSDENRLTLGAGNYGTLFGAMELTAIEHLEDSTIGASAFAGGHHADQTDTIAGNYLDRYTTGARVSRTSDATQADLLATVSHSEFGAQGFYGASPSYPAEEELTDTLVLGSLKFYGDPDQPAALGAAWRRTEDTYVLNRYKPSLYQNEHTTDFYTAHGAKTTTLTERIALDARFDTELESIRSRSLGDHDRSRGSIALIPDVTLGALTISIGGSVEFFSSDSTRLLPSAGAEWELAENTCTYLSYTEALRQPSYTELNYESPDSLGNTGLERQHTRTTEMGFKGEPSGGRWNLALFYERASDTVDWIKTDPGSRWTAENIDEIESFGAEATGMFSLSEATELGGTALILDKHTPGSYYAGRYALDYPLFSGTATLLHHLSEELMLRLTQVFAKYESNPVREGGDWLIDSSIDIQWHPPFSQRFALNAGVRNVFDDEFQFFPGQNSLGRSVYSSATYSW